MDNIREVTLEKIRIGIAQRLSSNMLDVMVRFSDSDTDAWIKNAVDMCVEGYIWGEAGKSETIKYPATWRDAFKGRWFPAWLLKRYPVNYRLHEISVKTLYPNFKISMPSETHVLKFQSYSHDSLSPYY